MEIHRISKSLAKTSEIEQRYVIYTKKDQNINEREKIIYRLGQIWSEQDITEKLEDIDLSIQSNAVQNIDQARQANKVFQLTS